MIIKGSHKIKYFLFSFLNPLKGKFIQVGFIITNSIIGT